MSFRFAVWQRQARRFAQASIPNGSWVIAMSATLVRITHVRTIVSAPRRLTAGEAFTFRAGRGCWWSWRRSAAQSPQQRKRWCEIGDNKVRSVSRGRQKCAILLDRGSPVGSAMISLGLLVGYADVWRLSAICVCQCAAEDRRASSHKFVREEPVVGFQRILGIEQLGG